MKQVKFPTKPFTIKQLRSRLNNLARGDAKRTITQAGLFLKLHRGVKRGEVVIVGTKPHGGRGRPETIYQGVDPEAVKSEMVVAVNTATKTEEVGAST